LSYDEFKVVLHTHRKKENVMVILPWSFT